MTTDRRTFVIVGAGQAGAWIARTLRTEGFEGRLVLIGQEPHPPYERPPLSKSVLVGTTSATAATLLSESDAASKSIEMWLSEVAMAVDRSNRTVYCATGRAVRYDKLFLATGASPRCPAWLSTQLTSRVHLLRTAEQADRLREALKYSRRLVIVGGGWIGLEVAASARALGVDVTVVEIAPRLCARSVPSAVSTYLSALHTDRGVDLRLETTCVGIAASDDHLVIELTNRDKLAADNLLVGVGISPETSLAVACGLRVEDGIVVDMDCRTSDGDIYAAGDVTRYFCPFERRMVRRESWANAQEQGIAAARAALGYARASREVPWVWSDQYDRNIQAVGTFGQETTVSLHGDPAGSGGCWLALDAAGRTLGAVAVNSPRELRAVRSALRET